MNIQKVNEYSIDNLQMLYLPAGTDLSPGTVHICWRHRGTLEEGNGSSEPEKLEF